MDPCYGGNWVAGAPQDGPGNSKLAFVELSSASNLRKSQRGSTGWNFLGNRTLPPPPPPALPFWVQFGLPWPVFFQIRPTTSSPPLIVQLQLPLPSLSSIVQPKLPLLSMMVLPPPPPVSFFFSGPVSANVFPVFFCFSRRHVRCDFFCKFSCKKWHVPWLGSFGSIAFFFVLPPSKPP